MPAEFSSAFSGTRRTLARAGLRAADELEPERPRLLIDLLDRVIDDLTGLDRREVDAELRSCPAWILDISSGSLRTVRMCCVLDRICREAVGGRSVVDPVVVEALAGAPSEACWRT